MAKFLNTRGRAKLAIAVCDRCHEKVAYSELRQDGNNPGIKVCSKRACFDEFDLWRLPPRQPEDITLRHPRPDTKIGILDVFLVSEYEESYLMTEDSNFLVLQELEGL